MDKITIKLAITLIFLLRNITSFKWILSDTLSNSATVLTFSERHMFSSEKGPFILPQGPSYINIENEVTILMGTNTTYPPKVAYAIFSPDEAHIHTNLEGMCEGDTYINEWAALV
jgi:hypothetical protein